MARNEIVYGLHASRQLLKDAPEQVLEAWLLESGRSEGLRAIESGLRQNGIATHHVSKGTLDRLGGGGVHQGVILRSRQPAFEPVSLKELLAATELPLFLLLDGVQDPHNLGACLRTAAAASVTAVLIPRDRATGVTETVRKVASGAVERVPLLRVTNLARTMEQLQENGVWLVGCAAEAGVSLYDVDLERPLALVMGAEGRGLRRLTRERCDYLVNIPMSGAIDSLNVSVATGICLFEALRQRSGEA